VLQPRQIFSDIEEEPIGAASLAQVHKATLKDGTVVAVKVQHPYVRGNSLVDMKTMEVISGCLLQFSAKYFSLYFNPDIIYIYIF
jgi:predicted unusual protein kinase regulating ubiquinone biosynthesis (AarF/ABC1/UbiB family)